MFTSTFYFSITCPELLPFLTSPKPTSVRLWPSSFHQNHFCHRCQWPFCCPIWIVAHWITKHFLQLGSLGSSRSLAAHSFTVFFPCSSPSWSLNVGRVQCSLLTLCSIYPPPGPSLNSISILATSNVFLQPDPLPWISDSQMQLVSSS